MRGMAGLAETIAKSRRAKENSGAQYGIIHGGRVNIGSRSYPFVAAVDCPAEDGDGVWVLLTKGGMAVVVGG